MSAPVAVGLLLLFVLMLAGPATSFRDDGDSGGSVLRQATYFGALVVVAAGSWRYRRGLLPLPMTVVAVFAYCAVSLSWSVVPDVGVRRLILTVMVSWTMFAGVRTLGYRSALDIFRMVAGAALVLNFLAVFFWPSFGIHQAEAYGDDSVVGAWRGFMMQKNVAGLFCAITVIVFIFDARRGSLPVRLLMIAGAAGFLYETQSKTSIGVLGAALVAGFLFRYYNPRFRFFAMPAVVLAVVGAVAAINFYWRDIVAPLDDPAAFTGRSQIWKMLLRYIADHPLLGTGYGSFWNIGIGSAPALQYGRGWVQGLSTGHNGYLDMAAAIGIPGMIFAVVLLFLWPLVLMLGDLDFPARRGALIVPIFIFLIGDNFTESTLLDRDLIGNMMLMFALALLAATRDERRVRI
jgi:O-antigen ligase